MCWKHIQLPHHKTNMARKKQHCVGEHESNYQLVGACGYLDYPLWKQKTSQDDSPPANHRAKSCNWRNATGQSLPPWNTCERRKPDLHVHHQKWPWANSHSPLLFYTYLLHRIASPLLLSQTSYSGSPACNCSHRGQLYPLYSAVLILIMPVVLLSLE